MTKNIIKETKYCQILNQGKITDKEYTYCVEKIFIKAIKRAEIRFSLYKDTVKSEERYIPRSLDVTEAQLLELLKESIEKAVFSKDFVKSLVDLLSTK